MHEAIPIIRLIAKMRNRGFDIPHGSTKVKCVTLEDNIGAIELAGLPKMRPRIKHILNVSYHHFRNLVTDGSVKVEHMITQN